MQFAVIAKDPLYASGLSSLLAHEGGLTVSGAVQSVLQGSRLIGGTGVLVVASDGLEVDDWVQLGQVKAENGLRVLLVQTSGDEVAGRSAADVIVHAKDGTSNLVSAARKLANLTGKNPQTVREPATQVYGRRQRKLTRRETEVANYVALGMTNRRISEVMGLQEQSIKNLVSSVMRKLDCENRVQVALKLTGRPTQS